VATPSRQAPRPRRLIARLLPTTLGIDATAGALFDDRLTAAGLGLAALHAAVLLAAGWAVYRTAIAKGLTDGRLGP
jgi:hypothetical protein